MISKFPRLRFSVLEDRVPPDPPRSDVLPTILWAEMRSNLDRANKPGANLVLKCKYFDNNTNFLVGLGYLIVQSIVDFMDKVSTV